MRDDYIVLVGGAPLNEEFGQAVGADAYCRDAGVAAETARRLIDERRARVPPEAPSTRRRRPRASLVIGCGALARELLALTRASARASRSTASTPELHKRPSGSPGAVEERIAKARARTAMTIRHLRGLRRLRHGRRPRRGPRPRKASSASAAPTATSSTPAPAAFAALQEEELGTFYLTDFLARQFETLVLAGLGLDRHPELMSDYFGELPPPRLPRPDRRRGADRARRAPPPTRWGSTFERRPTGYGELGPDHPVTRSAGGA